jgi:hypothetical protein
MGRFVLEDIHPTDVRSARLDRNEFSEERVRESLLRILDATPLCSIAMVAPGGHAHINAAYFSYSDQLELYFWSHPESLQGGRHILQYGRSRVVGSRLC